MSYVVLDIETSVKCPVGNFKAHPMWKANKVVALGMYNEVYSSYYMPSADDINNKAMALSQADMVVGHNVKFDLLYIYRDNNYPLPTLWDTQLAEYLLTGQQSKYASLDELTLLYRGEEFLKDDRVKAMWEAGVQTEDIPADLLLDYMRGDVENTNNIFLQQFAQAQALGMLPLIMTQMDALRATTQMARNGMCIDWEYVNRQRGFYLLKAAHVTEQLKEKQPDLDWASTKDLSLHFFGGERKYVERELVGVYKNGKDKYKNVDKVEVLQPLYNPADVGAELGKNGYYQTDDAVLSKLSHKGDFVAECVLLLRSYNKVTETYYGNLQQLRFPNGFIYPNLNHTATATGRLSCTNPNLQNQTDSGDVKRAYVSRYGVHGSVLELDYSQLEMVGLAYIANDQQLIDDINNGRDMHRELYKGMYGRYPTDKERKPFKRFSFLLVYGGGVSTLMAQSGCDRATARKFIDTFYTRYKGVKTYHETITKLAEANQEVFYSEDKAGPQYVYTHVSATGRRYVFQKYPSEYKKGLSYSPTELKNYPIQGFATGDVVPMMVGLLQRMLEENHTEGVHLLMTVHDSVIIDVHNNYITTVAKDCKDILENSPYYLKQVFNIDFPCKLSCGVEVGTNWQDKEDFSKELV